MNEQEKKILEQMDVAMAEKETEKTSKQEQEQPNITSQANKKQKHLETTSSSATISS